MDCSTAMYNFLFTSSAEVVESCCAYSSVDFVSGSVYSLS